MAINKGIIKTKTDNNTNDILYPKTSIDQVENISTMVVDLDTNQVIDGVKDFTSNPRVKVAHPTHNLPSAYQELEYIESTGTQYINTGIYLTNLHSVEVDYQLTSTSQSRKGIFGQVQTGLVNRFGTLLTASGNKTEYGYGSSNTYYQGSTLDLTRHKIRQDKNLLYVDGVLTYTFAIATFTATVEAPLGSFNYGSYAPAQAKYYESKWWNDNTLIRHFIPCYYIADEEPGMYDIVNDVFYRSASNDYFIAGPTVVPFTYEELMTDGNFAMVAKTGSYLDLVDTPTIPTVNNATLTIQKNGTTVNTFTANASSNVTANITVPTTTNDLTNDSGFITKSVNDLTNYTPTSSLATVATSGSYNDLSNKPTIPTNLDYVDLTSNQVIDGQKDFNTVPRVRIEGEHPREGLPDTYTQLQYVESDGSQYIDTTYAINTATDVVEMTFECVGTVVYKWLFGEHDNNARFGLGVGDGTNRRNVAYGTTTYKVNDNLFYDSLHYFKADSNGIFIDETKIANYSSFSSTSSLALFDLNNGGFGNGTAAKIQSYKHTRNNVALIDLVPVIRNSDDKAGFYDFVSESFIGSTNNIDLSPGPELPGPHYEALLTDASIPSATSQLINDSGYITSSYHDSTKANQSALNDVTAKIPVEASSSNQLADKAFVNSSIATATSTFRGTYTTLQALQAATGDLNDYAFYEHTDSAGNTLFDRYKYTSNTPHWEYEYTLNNSSFTADQWAALNSGVSLGAWVDTSTAQVISGQKDFNTIPRVKVTHQTHNLPNTYQEVEYIEFTGTQYIDSGVTGSLNSKILVQFQTTNTVSTNHGVIIGSRESATSKNVSFTINGTADGLTCSSTIIDFGDYTQTRLTASTTFGHWIESYTNKNSRYIKDLDKNTIVASNSNSYSASFTTPTNLMIGKPGSGYVASHTNYVGYMKLCQIWDDTTLVREFVPCYRVSDDKAGMFDTVNEVFYSSDGTNEFIAGPEVYPITYEALLTDASFAPVATSGSYNDLINKPTIPVVNNATLTIQKNGTTINTFTANASSNKTINITVPTNTNDLTNGAGFITSSDIPNIVTKQYILNLLTDADEEDF